MKYTGSIIGLQSSFGSIHNVSKDDTKCYLWRAIVLAEFKSSGLFISFNWNGTTYELMLKEIKQNYYTGKIIRNNETVGSIFLWVYNNENEKILKGVYSEEDAGEHDCFIELRQDRSK